MKTQRRPSKQKPCRAPASDAADRPDWHRFFGALRDHRDALREIDAVIEREFETVNLNDWPQTCPQSTSTRSGSGPMTR